MKIYSMTATFGKLEHETLMLQPGLNIIEAPNEWGKSTWCAFLVAMLYGIDTKERTKTGSLADKERYAPWSGNPMTGRIDLNWNGRDITIERATKGRSILGQFRAYETETGLDIPELTAANCGQMLLGVEKSVFTRSGFLKLTDLPVTQDESLRRRLNALVTTGDESGAGDTLAQKLRDLKNRCRFNRTGLLPQAEAQRGVLESKLRELQDLQTQSARIKERQVQLEERQISLKNHQTALEYEATRDYAGKLAAAETARDAAEAAVRDLEAVCAALPDSGTLENALVQLRALRDDRDALHMEVQMLPPAPQPPEIPRPFQGLDPDTALRQAQADARVHTESLEAAGKRTLLILGSILAVLGIGLLFVPNWIVRGIGIALMLAGCVCIRINLVDRRRAKATCCALQEKYAPLPPERWAASAHDFARAQAEHASSLDTHQRSQAELNRRMAELNGQVAALTQGTSLAEREQSCKTALESHRALADAQREYRRAEELVQALRSSQKEAPAPELPDTLSYTRQETARFLSDCTFEQRQLQLKLGNCQGRMEALGHADALQREMDAVNARIARLEDTHAALTIAMQTLSEASNCLQRRFAPRIASRAQMLFGKLTGNRYDRLVLAEDLSLSAGAQGEDTLRGALWRSDGTVDQLYLALRLAVAGELTPDAPLVLDDALVRFDDERLATAIALLKEEAENKQVILFTCQKRESALL